MLELCYHDGHFLPLEEAGVSPFDRGYNFGDGVYEVIRIYDGQPFEMEEHLARLYRSATAIDIVPRLKPQGYRELIAALIDQSGLREAMIYGQLTRGVAPRKHLYDDDMKPVDFWAVRPLDYARTAQFERGQVLLSVTDTRWSRCDVKTICLLPNVLAKKAAARAGADEAVFTLPGTQVLVEGSACNVFAVMDRTLYTHPICGKVLPGITRTVVMNLAHELGMETVEEPRDLGFFIDADEVFTTNTTGEILPAREIDGHTIGTGKPGPIARRLREAFTARIEATARGESASVSG